ncbi:MAG: hypothetical protein CL940_12805 [Deltaproteobacteria bacterium]|nr:hypothetical protein [Deltaproteobacteria bacterium]
MSGAPDAEDEPGVAPHGGPIRRFVMKHPFWVATIFGLLFFPTLKLMSVRHTPPNPLLGQVSPAAVTTTSGSTVQLPLATGEAWFVSALDAGDTRVTPAVLSALRDLRTQIERERLSLPIVVLLSPDASPEAIALAHQKLGANSEKTYIVTADETTIMTIRESLKPALGDGVKGLKSLARLGLVDASGGIRAGAPIGALGLGELVRRAVALEQRPNPP